MKHDCGIMFSQSGLALGISIKRVKQLLPALAKEMQIPESDLVMFRVLDQPKPKPIASEETPIQSIEMVTPEHSTESPAQSPESPA